MKTIIPYPYIQQIWNEWIVSPERQQEYFESHIKKYGIKSINCGNDYIVIDEKKYLLCIMKYAHN